MVGRKHMAVARPKTLDLLGLFVLRGLLMVGARDHERKFCVSRWVSSLFIGPAYESVFLFDETQLYRNLVSLAQPLADAGNFREAD